MNKKILILLFVALAISVVILFFIKQKSDKNKSVTGAVEPLVDSTAEISPTPNAANDSINTTHNSSVPTKHAPIKPNKITIESDFPLKYGSVGVKVKLLQIIVGVKVDGVWGKATGGAIAAKLKKGGEITKVDFLNYAVLPSAISKDFPLKKGSKGNHVKAVQVFLNVSPTGNYGLQTDAAVRKAGYTEITDATYRDFFNKFFV